MFYCYGVQFVFLVWVINSFDSRCAEPSSDCLVFSSLSPSMAYTRLITPLFLVIFAFVHC